MYINLRSVRTALHRWLHIMALRVVVTRSAELLTRPELTSWRFM
jgi:hypothetical protein